MEVNLDSFDRAAPNNSKKVSYKHWFPVVFAFDRIFYFIRFANYK